MADAFFTPADHYFHADYLTDRRADDDATEVLGLLGLEPGARLLDAGCGDGRLAVRFAALGFQVCAVDHDERQLDLLARRAVRWGVSVESLHSRLEHFESPEPFDAAVLWFCSWGFMSDDENRQVLLRLRAALVEGGVLVIDTLNPEGVKRYVDVHPEPVVTRRAGNRQIDRYHFDGTTSRLRSTRVVELNGETHTRQLSLSLPDLEGWERLLEDCGFALIVASARRGAPLRDDSWELVLRAEASPTPGLQAGSPR
jgi:cyclopropane fatty-acyl-phospholipid synthase-like methyltransferase